MNIPRYWARVTKQMTGKQGQLLDLAAWGWSGNNREEAERKAEERLSLLVARVQRGWDLDRGYAYGSRPLREEIIEEFQDTDHNVQAIITRNSYGSLILNTPQMLFIDVDFPKTTTSGDSLLGRLFGKRKAPETHVVAIDSIRETLQHVSGSSFRIYRTAAGLRIVGTDRPYEPAAAETEKIMRSVGSDPAFLNLCSVQKSFRARLTPKPWRCDVALPPGSFPRDKHQQERFLNWLQLYEQACNLKATCRFLEEVGRSEIHEIIRPFLEIHDEKTRALQTLPLA